MIQYQTKPEETETSRRENGVIHPTVVEGSESAVKRSEVEGRQTCIQCSCADGSIQCFCSNTSGESGDSRTLCIWRMRSRRPKTVFIYNCSNLTASNPSIPTDADCNTLANLMVNGVPAELNLNVVKTNGYYNIPVESILSWEFQGCGFALFNDVGSSYNVCAKDLVCLDIATSLV